MSIKVEYSDNFKSITENCVKSRSHLGGGNPSAKILFVGQESANEKREDWYDNNAKEWQNKILNNVDLLDFKREGKFKEGHTWNKYQRLHNYIFPENSSDDFINFEERVFTTEMSDNPAKRNGEAKKNANFKLDLQNRKDTFFNEDFIQDFKVVVLACSGYIVNNEKNWEINNLFKVEYPGDDFEYIEGFKASKIYSRGNWYFLHLNKEKTKLVIHTRQLSSNVNDDLLRDMGKIIREHLIKNSLL
jgi:hypothetical protein